MKDIAIMYHYVRERASWTGSVPIEIHDFEKQVERLAINYDIVSPNDLSKKTAKPKCVLTFDDATKDQYNNAFYILNKKGIPGYFTVMSGPIVDRKVPIFHLVHTTLSLFSDEEIWNALQREFILKVEDVYSNYYNYESNLYRRYNKYALNFLLKETQSRPFLEGLINAKYGSLESYIESFYISKEEFKKMHFAGMTIGVHCVHHKPYKGEKIQFYKEEIEPCKLFMENELDIKPEWYTPAFGGGEMQNELFRDLESILKENGFNGGFTTQQGFNQGNEEFWLKRFDCNKFDLY